MALNSPPTNFVDGSYLQPDFMNSLYLTDGGHKHDGIDMDGHAQKIDLGTDTVGQLTDSQITTVDATKLFGLYPQAGYTGVYKLTDSVAIYDQANYFRGDQYFDFYQTHFRSIDNGNLAQHLYIQPPVKAIVSGTEISTVDFVQGSTHVGTKTMVSGKLPVNVEYDFSTLGWSQYRDCSYDIKFSVIESSGRIYPYHFKFYGDLTEYLGITSPVSSLPWVGGGSALKYNAANVPSPPYTGYKIYAASAFSQESNYEYMPNTAGFNYITNDFNGMGTLRHMIAIRCDSATVRFKLENIGSAVAVKYFGYIDSVNSEITGTI